ncbi:MAG: diguanylate cyclase [Thermoleophilaceae bacterium]|nr:diguanylate cyclase [Thermoleophilaceae bacterium]
MHRLRTVSYSLFVLAASLAVAIFAFNAGVSFGPLDWFMERWVGVAIEACAAIMCVMRAVLVRDGRRAWTFMAIGVSLWALGDAYLVTKYFTSDPPIPSLADAGYIAFYPFAYIAIALLIRDRSRNPSATVWIDGLIAALAVAAVAAAVVFGAVLASIGGTPLATATNLSYPLGDLLLIALVVAAFAITGWQRDYMWFCLAGGFASFAVVDIAFLYQSAAGTYQVGGVMDLGWAMALVTIGFAATLTTPRVAVRAKPESWRSIALPICFALVAIGIEAYDHFWRVSTLAVLLATACLAAVVARLAFTFAHNLDMLHTSREEAGTDALTGLANRRQLALDLEESFEPASEGNSYLLVSLDLDGFKSYNDSFGHPAGDALLARLGHKLNEAVGTRGRAYRMGGDEFCVIFALTGEDTESLTELAVSALHEEGEGFVIGSSYGAVTLPAETSDAEAALQLADQRMYAQKQGGRHSAGSQSKDVLIQALAERDPALGTHMLNVAQAAVNTARALGITGTLLDDIERAAELHDIGKVAIPDEILQKPGPLDDSEWVFVKRHSEVGERIVGAAPALANAAQLVRHVHERMDGHGYPDGLAGERIPLGSRVIAVCNAYDAMTSLRPYRPTMTSDAACAELRKNAGSQFDSKVVFAFCAEIEKAEQAEIASAA